MKVAALDLGSNTTLCLIAEVENGVIGKVYYDETNVTKMGQGVHAQRRFHPEALARLDQCFGEYAAAIKKFGAQKVVAVATSAARDVTNGEELIRLGHQYGLPISIISGAKEAQLTFRGALCDRPSTAGIAVIDVGGGSTEIISDHDGSPKGTSVDVGSVRLTELFKNDVAKVKDYARAAFRNAPLPRDEFREIVAVAGTSTTLAALEQGRPFAEDLVHGFKLKLSAIENWINKLQKMTIAQREALPGMQPKRADVIVTGSIILAEAMRALGREEATVSTRGVRYGAALAWQDISF